MPKLTRLGGFIIILVCILAVAWFYEYPQKLNLAPQSIHHWRQSDCASITYNFYDKQLPFWQPQTMGLVSDSGTSAINLTSEVPLYYWGVARIYHVTGSKDWVLRGLNTAIFLLGICGYIFGMWRYSGNLIWSLLAGILFFSAPVLVYYGNNFLTNAPALGLALMALTVLSAFFRHGDKRFWWLAMLLFLLAGSLKITALFLFFATLGSALIFRKAFKGVNFRNLAGALLLVLLPLIAWLMFARMSNNEHNTVYFSTTIFPLWSLSGEDIRYIFAEIAKLWLKDYAHWSWLLAMLLMLVTVVVKPGSVDRRWKLIILLLIPGLLFFSLLQFYTFMQHDYYLINMYILPASLLMALSGKIGSLRGRLRSLLLVGFIILTATNLIYARERHQLRYTGYRNDVRAEFRELYNGGSEWLTEIGVAPHDSIIFIPDASHTSLYLLKRQGWTTHKMAFKDTTRDIYFNRDSAGIAQSIAHGAKYLILNDWHDLYGSRSYLLPFARHLQGFRNDLIVFNLRDTTRNFNLPDRHLRRSIIQEPDSADFSSKLGVVIESPEALTGSKTLMAEPGEQYILATDISSVNAGELIRYQFWVKADPSKKVVPVISSLEPGLIFMETPETVEERGPWRLLRQEYVVETRVAEEGLRCFIWNPDGAKLELDAVELSLFKEMSLKVTD